LIGRDSASIREEVRGHVGVRVWYWILRRMRQEVVVMDDRRAESPRSPAVSRGFEPNRLAGQRLADTYERAVPVIRQGLVVGDEGRGDRIVDGEGQAEPMRLSLPG
jgi:hypothetical protein